LEGESYFLGKVGIVGGLGVVGAEVHDFVAGLGEIDADLFLERETGVVGGDDEFQSALLRS
jgi:hypothetical protein